MSQRKIIRARVVDILKNYGSYPSTGGSPTDAGLRVYPNMTKKLHKDLLPCIVVYTQQEDSEEFDSSPRSCKKTLSLIVEVVAECNEALDDTLDDICQQVETVFNEYQFVPQPDDELVESCDLVSTKNVLSVDGAMQTGSALMTYRIVYVEDAVASGNVRPHLLVPFKGVNVDSRPQGSTDETPTEKDQVDFTWQ